MLKLRWFLMTAAILGVLLAQTQEVAAAPPCPRCGSAEVVQIQYGLPRFTPELKEAVRRGEVVLGGCVISADSPKWACRNCGQRFGKLREDGPASQAPATK
jgi:predicted RNA-binding Zn-ribbon protein involved in translation (DUF1610 family)